MTARKPYSILVVDDDTAVSSIINIILKSEGYKIITAGTGKEALSLFENKHPDLILLDVNLPDIDGYTILQIIRKSSEVPVIMVTGGNDSEGRVKGLNMGADDYISKPFKAEDLRYHIYSALH